MTKPTRIEEVVANKIRLSYDPVRGFLCSYEGLAKEICQLFPQPLPTTLDKVCPNGVDGLMSGHDGEKGIRVPCIICKGTGKLPQPLDDKELREKIEELKETLCYAVHAWERGDISYDIFQLIDDDITDQILIILQPKIEEAKREERERITEEVLKPLLERIKEVERDLKALKGG